MKNSWKLKKLDEKQVLALCEKHGLSTLVVKILLSKNITTPKEIKEYLFPDPYLRSSPYAFKSMEKAVSKIRECIDNKKSIYIYGDKDVDGVTSLALLINFFEKLGVETHYSVTSKETSYGFTDTLIDDIAKKGAKLLISVDCGIKENEAVKKLSSLGIDVIITDHHNPPDELPLAYAVINPKCEDHFLGYEREISGCAVAFKLAEAVLLSYLPNLHEKALALSLEKDGFRGSILKAFSIEERAYGSKKDLKKIECDIVIGFKKDEEELKKIFKDKTVLIEDYASAILNCGVSDKTSLSNALAMYFEDDVDFLSKAYIKLSRIKLPSLERYFYDYIDLAGISTICDVMPLKGENRLFVKEGIKSLNNGCRIGIRELNREINFYTGPITESRISMYLGPAINSAGRIDSADISLNLLLNSKEEVALANAKNLVEINNERKKIADSAFKSALSYIVPSPDEKSVFYRDDLIPSGITGIIAQKISNHFNKPSVVLTKEEDGTVIGSARAPGKMNVLEGIKAASNLLLQFGGHEGACGFSFDAKNYEAVITLIKDYFNKTPEISDKTFDIISEVLAEDINTKAVKIIESLGPYGEENPHPLFLLRRVHIKEPKVIGKAADSIRFKIEGCDHLNCLGWGFADTVINSFSEKVTFDIVFSAQINYFRGKETIQLVIEDIDKS